MDEFDIIVVGGGLVGASAALSLADGGWRVALVEAQVPDFEEQLLDGWDSRIYAISPLNRRFLGSLLAWPGDERIAAVNRMSVYGDDGGHIQFSAADAGVSALAWIAENRWLLASLWQGLEESSVTLFTGAMPQALSTSTAEAQLTLTDGRVLRGRLLAGADGANSWVRSQAGIACHIDDYQQSGVVANFACEKAHYGIAYQWFLDQGDILAWLPMPGNRFSIVWSTHEPQRLLELTPQALADQVAAAGGHTLGALECITPAAAFALRLVQPNDAVTQRVALLGDAAHTVHPLAGQGVNLGFQDAQKLTSALHGERDPGDWLLLRRYARGRLAAVRTMQLGCDALYRLFGSQQSGVSWLRNTGLSLTGKLSPLRRQLARYAAGL